MEEVSKPICPYCHNRSKQVTGEAIYPHREDLFNLTFYSCDPCGAYVGCHGTSNKPLGRLANAQLRQAKSAAHRAFDPLWRNKIMTRQKAYKWLAQSLQINGKNCHIGMFDVKQCEKVIELVKNRS
jgi:hypothetical protein